MSAFQTGVPLPTIRRTAESRATHLASRGRAFRSRPSIPRATIAAPMDAQPTLPHADEALPSETSAPWMPLPGVVHEIMEPEQFDRLLEVSKGADGLLVADFMATWCRKCLYLVPKLRKLAVEYPSVYYCTVNVNRVRRLPKEFSITNMPTFVFLKGGERVERFVGGAPPPQVAQMLGGKIDELSP